MTLLRSRILVCEPRDFSETVVSRLRQHADVELREISSAELPAVLDTYDVLWLRLAHRLDAALIAGAKRCRVVATAVTGLDHIDLEACNTKGIRVVSLKGETAFLKSVRATAELTLGLLMALMRRIPEAAASVKSGRWDRDSFRGNELNGKTAGIIGVGRLGTLVAGYLRAFGMRVIGYDIRADWAAEVTGVECAESLASLLEQSDVVTIHVDLNHGSRNLIDARALQQMKRGGWLVNTSRGGVVDEGALIAALESGHLKGAAIDVLTGEPLVDARHPVVRYANENDNLLLVPHIGGNTCESFEKTESFIATRVLEALE